MKNGVRLVSAALTAGLVGFMSLAAVGETQVWEGAVNVTGNVADDIQLKGDVSVNMTVAATINGNISDAENSVGKIIKKGNQTLTLPTTVTNTYTGGTVIEKGKLTVSGNTSNSQNSPSTPLGTGKVTVMPGCTLVWNGCHANDVEYVNGTSQQSPFFNRGGGTGYNGDVVINGDVWMMGYDTRPDGTEYNAKLGVLGSLTAQSNETGTVVLKDIYFGGGTWLALGCVTCNVLTASYEVMNKDNSFYPAMFSGFSLSANFAKSRVGLVRLDQGALDCTVDGVANGFALELFGGRITRTTLTKDYNNSWPAGKEINTSYIRLNTTATARTQTFRWVKSDPRDDDEPNYDFRSTGTGRVTMNITGEENVTAVCSMKLGAKIDLVIDAPASFAQIFSNRVHEIDSPIVVRSGTLGFAGTATAEDVASISLETVAAALSIGEGCTPFTDDFVLDVVSDSTIDLKGDLTVKKLLVNGEEYPRGSHTTSKTFNLTGGGTLTVLEGPEPVVEFEINVPDGETVFYDQKISGSTVIAKTGRGRLVITNANDFTGGTMLYDGILEITDRNALGTGDIHIYGSTTESRQLCLNAPCADTDDTTKIPNNLIIDAPSSREYPAVHFARSTHFNGTILAKADFYFSTYTPSVDGYGTSPQIKLYKRVTAEEGARIAAPPHVMVAFQGGLATPLLEGYYTEPGWAANGGNSGGFRLHNVTGASNVIGRITLDQTYVRCQNSSVCTNAIVSFTGEHKLDGVGYFDLYGNNQSISIGETAECSTEDGGQQITNSVTTATPALTVLLKSSNCYAKFDGPMSLVVNSSDTTHLYSRRHTMAYFGIGTAIVHGSGKIYFDTGTVFPGINSLGGNSGGVTYFSAEDQHVFDNVERIYSDSHNHIIMSAEMAKGLSRGHRLAVTCNSSGNYGMCVAENLALDAASLTAYSFATGTKIVWPCGEYTKAEVKNMVGNGVSAQNNSGKIRVWAARTAWTNVTWKGEADADLGDATNWTNTDDDAATAATFGVPLNKATIASGESATANGIVNFGKLTVTTDFTVNGSGIVAFYDDGLETGGNGSTVTFNVPVDFQTDKFVVATGDTVKFAGGLTNEVDDAAIDEYVVPATNAGTIELGGVIPAKLTVNGGTLAIAEDATPPADDTLVLVLAEGAKISVPNGMVLRTKTVTVAGVQAGVGYYADDWVTGGGKVRVNESTTPPTVETATWNAAGDEELFSESANWNPDTTEMSWAGKYRTVFAAKGAGAVVDGAFNLVDMTFGAESAGFAFTGSEGASLTLAEGLKIAEKTDVTVERTFMFGVPVTNTNQVNATLTIPSNDTVVCAAGGSFGVLTLDGEGRMEVAGETAMNGTTLVSNTVLAVSGTLSGSGNLTLPFIGYGQTAITSPALELNEATLQKTLKLSDLSTECKCLIRSSAPVGTTNYIATASDGASMHTYFERGRTFVIDSWSMSGKHEFLSIGDTGDGRVTVVLTWASQSVRSSPDGHLTISSGVDLILGQTSQTNMKSNKLVVNSGGSVTFTTDDAFVESYARGDRQAAFKLTGGDVYMGGTHQNCSILNGAATVHGEMGSEIEMLYGAPARATSGNDVDPTFTGNLSEHVSLTMNGLLTNTLNGVSSTDGKIAVKAGTLVLGVKAALKNASEVKVEGGVLVVNAMDPFSRDVTALTVTGGAIEVAAEKSLGVASAMVNGEPVAIGTYTTEQPGPFENILTGGGKIRVGKVGMMLILK